MTTNIVQFVRTASCISVHFLRCYEKLSMMDGRWIIFFFGLKSWLEHIVISLHSHFFQWEYFRQCFSSSACRIWLIHISIPAFPMQGKKRCAVLHSCHTHDCASAKYTIVPMLASSRVYQIPSVSRSQSILSFVREIQYSTHSGRFCALLLL